MSEEAAKLPCFRCGRIPEFDTAAGAMTGTASFSSRGGYGCIYNPMVRDVWIRINICNNCLTWGADSRFILEGRVLDRPDIGYSFWDPASSF